MKYNDNGEYKDIYVKTFDTLPIGAIVEYSGATIPSGWTEVADPNTYSTTEEVRVGTWIDGKPLYRKVYIFPTLANTGNVSVNIDNTFKVQKYDIYVENPNNFKFKLPVMGTNYISSFMDYTSNKLTIQTTSDRTAFTNNYAIIEYTKTTD